MAKATDTQPEATESKIVTPEMLAKELGVDGKRIRAFLRSEFTRPTEEKNTSWVLNAKQAEAVRERFTPSEDEDADDES